MRTRSADPKDGISPLLHAARTCLVRVAEHGPKVSLSWVSAACLLAAGLDRMHAHGSTPACRHCGATLLSAEVLRSDLESWPSGASVEVEVEPESIVRFVYAPRVGGVCSLACWQLADGPACPVQPADFFDL